MANESNCVEVIIGARGLMESLICVMECHYDGYSWGKVKEVVHVMLDFVKGKLDDQEQQV